MIGLKQEIEASQDDVCKDFESSPFCSVAGMESGFRLAKAMQGIRKELSSANEAKAQGLLTALDAFIEDYNGKVESINGYSAEVDVLMSELDESRHAIDPGAVVSAGNDGVYIAGWFFQRYLSPADDE